MQDFKFGFGYVYLDEMGLAFGDVVEDDQVEHL